ncbi:hypothetical protein GIY21_10310 [Xanthomonas sontii]|uniref:CHAT domain-containing protein n=1 Tax=Xanthomonas sontii TaxID=2650745 RepID=A0A6N7Q8H1_9XANT|nr:MULTISPECIES: hypothetical protein [Xanthomonas]MRH00683.1 hypothetical protein [Xanthomonas sontii]MRH75015.1 hypothetical protein [Xanthomonas sontii]
MATKKKRGRPHFGYFIFDCPSDHEIDGSLVTESDAIRSVLWNKSLGGRLKGLRLTTAESFNDAKERKYTGVRYVHLGGHASKTGIGFIGGSVKWQDVAEKLTKFFPKLGEGEQRVLTLSCCHSIAGVKAMGPILKGHFSAIYHFKTEEIGFSQAMTIWSMFYLKKKLSRPHGAIMKDINTFFGSEVLGGIAP